MSHFPVRFLAPLAIVWAGAASAAPTAAVFGGRVACAEQDGVQFCQGGLATRVESFDGVPLDLNVTLPPAALDGPFPLIVELHGFAQAKSSGPAVARALAGYAVLSYTARGFGQSCGMPASRASDPSLANPDVCVERGWVRLADARYEARDTLYLAGLLADEGLVLPAKVGVTGASYGGGQALILAALRNRVMLPDGSLVPWQSPEGLDLEIAAAVPLIPWSDLAESLVPAGRTLDTRSENPYGARTGVLKQSWVNLLYLAGGTLGFYAPIGVDPGADLAGWKAFLDAGEPYDGAPLAAAMLDEVTTYHSAYYVDDGIAPAPLFIYNAWTDDLFPVDESVRFYLKTRARYPDAEITLHYSDAFGHPRAALGAGLETVNARVTQFLDRHLKGTGLALPAVEAYTQACGEATVAGPFTAASWDALSPGEVRFVARKKQQQEFDASGGDPALEAGLDPFAGGPCRTFPAAVSANAATYTLPAASGAGYTLLGAPTVIADLTVSGSFAQIVARLWDVAPDLTQTLVSHSIHRPRSDNASPQVFQLHPNGWHFAAGHAPKLELVGQSPPYGRAAGGDFRVRIAKLELRLPVAEAAGGAILAPAAPVVPPDAEEPGDTGTPGCPEQPVEACGVSARGSLLVREDADPARDLLTWKWKGEGTPWGDATATAAFRLCVYDPSDALIASAAIPAGGLCGAGKQAKPCWKRRGRTQSFADPGAAIDGIRDVALRSDKEGARSARLRAAGGSLVLPTLPLSLPVRAQLVGNGGGCWGASFGDRVRENSASEFDAVAD